jgi:inhibitor of cysteine peptidase
MSRFLCLLACFAFAQAPDVVRVTIPRGDPVVLAAGQRLVVEAKGNASTGYAWAATSVPECLVQVGEPAYVQDPSDGRVGVGGRYILTFEARAAGKGVLELTYARPWEKEKEKAAEVARVTVEVR